MTLPVLSKTWQHSANNQVTAQGSQLLCTQAVLFAVMTAILAVGTQPATCRYSCDSTTAGTAGDGTNRLTAANKFVWNNAGSAHSWIVFRQTGIGATWEILFSCEGASATGATLTVVYSKSAAFTGGTTTARPTATDEVVVSAGGAPFGLAGNFSVRWTVMQSTDGKSTKVLFTSNNAFIGIWGWEAPDNAVTGFDSYVYIIPSSINVASLTATGNTTIKTRIGSTTGNLFLQSEGNSTIQGASDTVYGNAANQVSGEWPFWPLGIACSTSGILGRHGSMVDTWFGSGARASADRYPAGGSATFAQFGPFIVPWNGGAVNLT